MHALNFTRGPGLLLADRCRRYFPDLGLCYFRISNITFGLVRVRLRQGSRLHSLIDPAPEAIDPTIQKVLSAFATYVVGFVEQFRFIAEVNLWLAHENHVAHCYHCLSAFCPTAAPIVPGEAPMIAAGFASHEFCPFGRLARSIAFLMAGEKERLYSGVTNTMPSAASISRFRRRTDCGGLSHRSSL